MSDTPSDYVPSYVMSATLGRGLRTHTVSGDRTSCGLSISDGWIKGQTRRVNITCKACRTKMEAETAALIERYDCGPWPQIMEESEDA